MESSLYPEESVKLNFVEHLEELRVKIIIVLAVLLLTTIISFINCELILQVILDSVVDLIPELVFIAPTEAFTSYLKVALLSGFILAFPVILYQLFTFIAPAFSKIIRKRIILWLLIAFLLFIIGITFSYFIAFPAALRFLITFGNEVFYPMITAGKFISFFGALMLIGGFVFEIPIAVALAADLGFVNTLKLKQKRHIAFLFILIVAAVITPTQDIVNMLIFAVPMMALFEVGILIAWFLEKRK